MLTRSPAPQAVRLSAIVVAGPAASAPSELRIFANPPVSDSPPITTPYRSPSAAGRSAAACHPHASGCPRRAGRRRSTLTAAGQTRRPRRCPSRRRTSRAKGGPSSSALSTFRLDHPPSTDRRSRRTERRTAIYQGAAASIAAPYRTVPQHESCDLRAAPCQLRGRRPHSQRQEALPTPHAPGPDCLSPLVHSRVSCGGAQPSLDLPLRRCASSPFSCPATWATRRRRSSRGCV